VVLADSHGLSQIPRYLGNTIRTQQRLYLRGPYPLWRSVPDLLRLVIVLSSRVLAYPNRYPHDTGVATPPGFDTTLGLGSSPFARRYLGSRGCFPFLKGTEMFQFPLFPPPALYIQAGVTPHLPVPGFPIRRSTDQSLVDSSPWLIAVAHVLLRLQAPRHPPLALNNLEFRYSCSLFGV